jgi:hypothetical protein
MEKYSKKAIKENPAVAKYLNAGTAYAKALQDSVEFPSPENSQKVLEMGRTVLLKAAGLMSQETLAKLGDIQRERMMRNE